MIQQGGFFIFWLCDNFSGGNNFILKFDIRFRKFEKFPKSFSERRQNCQRAIFLNQSQMSGLVHFSSNAHCISRRPSTRPCGLKIETTRNRINIKDFSCEIQIRQ